MEDDIDIYEDLPSFHIKSSESLDAPNDQENITRDLEKQVADLTVKLQDCQKANETLETNLFSLLKTAKAEIARKDKMIEDLRKKLDDSVFRRGMYVKTNEFVVCKSNFYETVTNRCYKPVDAPLSPAKRKLITSWTDLPSSNLTKGQHGKSTLTPITIFGERLRKKIAEEENLEKKDKQLIEFNIDRNCDENVEGYVAESDKENGSLRDTNSCNTHEIQESAIVQYPESERAKSPVITSKIATKDFLQNIDKDEVETKSQRKSTLNGKWTGKRAHEETTRSTSVKRIKTAGEKFLHGTAEKDLKDFVRVESIQKNGFMKHDKFESLDNLPGRLKHSSKNSDVERPPDPNVDMKKRQHVPKKYRIERGKDTTKDESDASCEKKESAKGHFSKRYNHGATTIQESTSVSDERNMLHRGVETFDRDNYRISTDKRYRAKQRERHLATMDDHRSRGRLHSIYGKCREEKYNRSKYHSNNKYASHGETFEVKRYDIRSGVDKSKASGTPVDKVLSSESRIMIDRTKRLAIDRRVNNEETCGRRDEYESRRPKSIDRSIKREKRHEYSHRKSSNEKLIECSKYSKVSRSRKSVEKSDCIDERFGRDGLIKLEVSSKFHDEPQNRTDQLQIHSEQLEDGEILTSATNTSSENNSDCKDSKDGSEACSESNLCRKTDRANRETEYEEGEVEEAAILLENVERSESPENADNAENAETVENVESIEKFIRNYVSTGENVEEVSLLEEKISTDINVALESNREDESSSVPNSEVDRKIDSHDGKETRNDEVETTVSRENGQVDIKMMPVEECAKNVESLVDDDIERLAQNSLVELSGTDIVSDRATENVTDTTSKDNVVLEKSSSCASKIAFDSCKGKEGNENEHNDKDGIESNDYDINTNNRDKTVESNYQCVDRRSDDDNNNNEKKDNRNNSEGDRTKGEKESTSVVTTKSAREKETIGKCSLGEKGSRLCDSSVNVRGKIVVFARRRKPVCLANNNANMTVLMNTDHKVCIDSSGLRNATAPNSVSKVRACRRS